MGSRYKALWRQVEILYEYWVGDYGTSTYTSMICPAVG